MKTCKFKIADLNPAEYNPRTITKEALRGLQKSIDKFGYLQHVVVNVRDDQNRIISGHQRVKALEMSGETSIECITVDFDPVTEKAANVALNAESISGDWNLEDLEVILQELKIEFPEFEDINLDTLADDLNIELENFEDESEAGTADEVPEVPEKTSIKLGDHTVLCGDSTKIEDVEKLMGGEKIDLVFSDPPYGIDVVGKKGNIGGDTKTAPTTKFRPVINDDKEFDPSFLLNYADKVFMWGANYFAHLLPRCGRWFVWDKNRPEGLTLSDCELAWSNIKGVRVQKFKCTWDGYHKEGESGTRVHPNQKPIKLLVDILNELNIPSLFEPFLGSGSTLIACEKTGRKCYGIEIDPHYVSVIIQRWCDYTGKDQVMINDELVTWSHYSRSCK